MINSERLLKEAREQHHTCEFCYYEYFDDRAYPCSRCVCNQPTENMWRPKIKTAHGTPETYLAKSLRYSRDNHEIAKDEPQERSE